MSIDIERLRDSIDDQWRASIDGALREYVRIPSLSPAFDPHWRAHGHIDAAIRLLAHWCRAQPIPGIRVEIHEPAGLTPLLLVEVPGALAGSIVIYGHLDKQPEMTGWEPGLGPWQPVERDGKLYGRGSADDGYSVFSALSALVALHEQGIQLPRCLLMIEASEESGSIHLQAHLEALAARLGTPFLVICLDAECGNYDQLWSTTSLRGCVEGLLHVRVLSAAVHSGLAGGIAPTALRIATQLLARIENPATGQLQLPELNAEMSSEANEQIAVAARILGPSVMTKAPLLAGVRCIAEDSATLLANNYWQGALTVTGVDGFPCTATAGNVIVPDVTLRVSCRLPPSVDATEAAEALRSALESDAPYGAHVCFEVADALSGWAALPATWLRTSLQRASRRIFGAGAIHFGCGGTIPFLPMLARRFPDAQFFVTGVLGPASSAHGPNECLHIEYARKLTCCLALVIADCAAVPMPARGNKRECPRA
jgi:acetylornithine deacetylase/succinyl-diaminopimelate desuccinylase-like protein